MSAAEIKEEIKARLATVNDEKVLAEILNVLNNPNPRLSIDEMYNEAVQQYGDTLRKLAQ